MKKYLILSLLLVGCSQPDAKSAADFCALRAAYKSISDGKLEPVPGSPRAKLEEAEYRFCATLKP